MDRAASVRTWRRPIDDRLASPGVSCAVAPPVVRAGLSVPIAQPERRSPSSTPHNLSLALTSFVGRDLEISEAQALLCRSRLLTLAGTGGVGKTRLAQEIAANLVRPTERSGEPGSAGDGPADDATRGLAFPDGVWLVELAAISDPLLVSQAVATVLGMQESPGQSLTSLLIDALHQKQLLLVLDNCEHLVDAIAAFADTVLRQCPRVQILATSRQPLEIAGETTFRVPSLALTPRLPSLTEVGATSAPERGPARADAAFSEAARLFAERARAAVPDFDVDACQIEIVETICRRLDGIPLAIELAAARVGVLSLEQIATRLNDRFRLLTGGCKTSLPRYRTLRAMIDWSHDLLDERERTLLRRLAVFAGGWTLDAVEAVCADDDLIVTDLLDLIAGLVAKSMVFTTQHGDTIRYGFLESVREYADDKLRASCDADLMRERHRDWALALAERAEAQLRGPRASWWMDHLERERENLRAALSWCTNRGDAVLGFRLAGSLWRFWLVRGPYREVRSTLADLLTAFPSQRRSAPVLEARAKVLYAAGRLAMRQDDREAAEGYFQEALDINHELGDLRGVAIALFGVGHVARVWGDYAKSGAYHERAVRLFAALGECSWLAQTLADLGVAAFFQGDLARAREYYETSLSIYEGLGDELGILSSLNELGEVALCRGELDTARTFLTASLTMARRMDDKERIAMTLAALAGVAAGQRQPVRAVRLGAAAFRLNELTGQRNSPSWYATVERWLEPARVALSADACLIEEAAGRTMLLDDVIAYAIAGQAEAHSTITRQPARNAPPLKAQRPVMIAPTPGSLERVLTRREHEVAALVARGLTNRQIADVLVITEGTAANHVKNILARLVLESRVQIAVWATENGLRELASA